MILNFETDHEKAVRVRRAMAGNHRGMFKALPAERYPAVFGLGEGALTVFGNDSWSFISAATFAVRIATMIVCGFAA